MSDHHNDHNEFPKPDIIYASGERIGEFKTRGDQPRASETTLNVLRARLTGGNLDGLYIKLDGVWTKAEDAFDHCFVMRDGDWVKAENPDIERWLLSITNGG